MEKHKAITDEEIKEQLKETFLNNLKGVIGNDKMVNDTVSKVIDYIIPTLRDVPISTRGFLYELKKKYRDIFENFDEEIFIRIVRHMRMVGEQKREKKRIGVNFVYFTNDNARRRFVEDPLEGRLALENPSYKIKLENLLNNEKTTTLKRTYRFINPKTSFYACNKDEILGIYKFNENGNDDVFANMVTITNNGRALGFSIEGGSSCIRIFFNGQHIADYFVSEQVGRWICHYPKDLDKLFLEIPINDNDRAELVKKVIDLAYLRKGAIIVLTNENNKDSLKSSQSIELDGDVTVSDISNNIFNCYAENDGATIFKLDGHHAYLLRFGVILQPSGSLIEDYSNLIKNSVSGARHEKAALYACNNPNDYVIVVSENRSISYLHGANPIYWKDEFYVDVDEYANK